jgi:diguanylate cyclase (GGDEF)-like protein/PAS domain S-box-containing protein
MTPAISNSSTRVDSFQLNGGLTGAVPHPFDPKHEASLLAGNEPLRGENEDAWHSLVHARFGVVSGIYVALRAKHPPAAAHSLRVAFWTSAWAMHHGLREEQLQLFEVVALLHEVGKIGVPDRVLQKPERLNETEQSLMDMHTQVGIEILRSSGASKELLIALAGIGTNFESSSDLASPDIAPIASRLVNIVDAYDSMTSKQVYRESLSREAALAELLRMAGTQFDPKLVRSFAEIVITHDRALQARVAERWISELEKQDLSRFFDFDDHHPSSLFGSSIIHSLNDSFYRHMMDHIDNGVIFIDSEYRVLDWNRSAERITGRSAESVQHQAWTPEIAGLCDTEGFPLRESHCPFRALMTTGAVGKQRLAVRTPTSELVQISMDVVPVANEYGLRRGGAIILEDVSETAELERKIVHLRERACQDQLTKVANRGELNRQLPEFVSYHQRTRQSGSVIICDIDFFKKINDNFSHQAGDEALIIFAKLLKDSCRETDFVARYGGEEFVILCSQCDLAEAKSLGENIRKKLQRTPLAVLRNQCMTASFGVATINPEDTEESVLGRADRGLLIAKENGRDRVVSLGDEERKALEKTSSTPKRWFHWFSPAPEQTTRSELLTNVPRPVTLEKLKGFVRDFKAAVHEVNQDSVILDLDFKTAPIPKLKDERMGKYRMTIRLAEIEMATGGNKQHTKICTLLDVEIAPLGNRDRRSDSLRSQSLRIKTELQGFLVAHEMDEEIRQNVLRKIKNETDSRY